MYGWDDTGVADDHLDNLQPLDLNGDGQIDAYGEDTTSSGNIDTVYLDTNGDGQLDMVEHDGNLDSLPDVVGVDTTGSGQVDTIYLDTNGDGTFDMVTQLDPNGEVTNSDLSARDGLGDSAYDNTSGHVPDTNIRSSTGSDLDDDGTISFMEIPTNSEHIGREPYYDQDIPGIMPAQFDINSGEDGVTGHPVEDMAYWHMQTHDNTCAVVSQEFILEDLTGQQFDENELMQIAQDHGWYNPEGGTTMDNVGKLLEFYGLHVEQSNGTTDSLETALSHGDKVIVGIDADEIWSNGSDTLHDQLDSVRGIPDSDANHAVEVIGIDHSDPNNPMVILNDPGHPGGQGSMIPLELFQQAWADSGNFMVTANN